MKHIKLFMLYLIFRKPLIAFRFSALLHYKKKKLLSQRVPTKIFIVKRYLPPSSGCPYFHCPFARIELVANIQDLQKKNYFKSLALRNIFIIFTVFQLLVYFCWCIYCIRCIFEQIINCVFGHFD